MDDPNRIIFKSFLITGFYKQNTLKEIMADLIIYQLQSWRHWRQSQNMNCQFE